MADLLGMGLDNVYADLQQYSNIHTVRRSVKSLRYVQLPIDGRTRYNFLLHTSSNKLFLRPIYDDYVPTHSQADNERIITPLGTRDFVIEFYDESSIRDSLPHVVDVLGPEHVNPPPEHMVILVRHGPDLWTFRVTFAAFLIEYTGEAKTKVKSMRFAIPQGDIKKRVCHGYEAYRSFTAMRYLQYGYALGYDAEKQSCVLLGAKGRVFTLQHRNVSFKPIQRPDWILADQKCIEVTRNDRSVRSVHPNANVFFVHKKLAAVENFLLENSESGLRVTVPSEKPGNISDSDILSECSYLHTIFPPHVLPPSLRIGTDDLLAAACGFCLQKKSIVAKSARPFEFLSIYGMNFPPLSSDDEYVLYLANHRGSSTATARSSAGPTFPPARGAGAAAGRSAPGSPVHTRTQDRATSLLYGQTQRARRRREGFGQAPAAYDDMRDDFLKDDDQIYMHHNVFMYLGRKLVSAVRVDFVPEIIEVSPDHRFVFVSATTTQNIAVFYIQEDTRTSRFLLRLVKTIQNVNDLPVRSITVTPRWIVIGTNNNAVITYDFFKYIYPDDQCLPESDPLYAELAGLSTSSQNLVASQRGVRREVDWATDKMYLVNIRCGDHYDTIYMPYTPSRELVEWSAAENKHRTSSTYCDSDNEVTDDSQSRVLHDGGEADGEEGGERGAANSSGRNRDRDHDHELDLTGGLRAGEGGDGRSVVYPKLVTLRSAVESRDSGQGSQVSDKTGSVSASFNTESGTIGKSTSEDLAPTKVRFAGNLEVHMTDEQGHALALDAGGASFLKNLDDKESISYVALASTASERNFAATLSQGHSATDPHKASLGPEGGAGEVPEASAAMAVASAAAADAAAMALAEQKAATAATTAAASAGAGAGAPTDRDSGRDRELYNIYSSKAAAAGLATRTLAPEDVKPCFRSAANVALSTASMFVSPGQLLLGNVDMAYFTGDDAEVGARGLLPSARRSLDADTSQVGAIIRYEDRNIFNQMSSVSAQLAAALSEPSSGRSNEHGVIDSAMALSHLREFERKFTLLAGFVDRMALIDAYLSALVGQGAVGGPFDSGVYNIFVAYANAITIEPLRVHAADPALLDAVLSASLRGDLFYYSEEGLGAGAAVERFGVETEAFVREEVYFLAKIMHAQAEFLAKQLALPGGEQGDHPADEQYAGSSAEFISISLDLDFLDRLISILGGMDIALSPSPVLHEVHTRLLQHVYETCAGDGGPEFYYVHHAVVHRSIRTLDPQRLRALCTAFGLPSEEILCSRDDADAKVYPESLQSLAWKHPGRVYTRLTPDEKRLVLLPRIYSLTQAAMGYCTFARRPFQQCVTKIRSTLGTNDAELHSLLSSLAPEDGAGADAGAGASASAHRANALTKSSIDREIREATESLRRLGQSPFTVAAGQPQAQTQAQQAVGVAPPSPTVAVEVAEIATYQPDSQSSSKPPCISTLSTDAQIIEEIIIESEETASVGGSGVSPSSSGSHGSNGSTSSSHGTPAAAQPDAHMASRAALVSPTGPPVANASNIDSSFGNRSYDPTQRVSSRLRQSDVISALPGIPEVADLDRQKALAADALSPRETAQAASPAPLSGAAGKAESPSPRRSTVEGQESLANDSDNGMANYEIITSMMGAPSRPADADYLAAGSSAAGSSAGGGRDRDSAESRSATQSSTTGAAAEQVSTGDAPGDIVETIEVYDVLDANGEHDEGPLAGGATRSPDAFSMDLHAVTEAREEHRSGSIVRDVAKHLVGTSPTGTQNAMDKLTEDLDALAREADAQNSPVAGADILGLKHDLQGLMERPAASHSQYRSSPRRPAPGPGPMDEDAVHILNEEQPLKTAGAPDFSLKYTPRTAESKRRTSNIFKATRTPNFAAPDSIAPRVDEANPSVDIHLSEDAQWLLQNAGGMPLYGVSPQAGPSTEDTHEFHNLNVSAVPSSLSNSGAQRGFRIDVDGMMSTLHDNIGPDLMSTTGTDTRSLGTDSFSSKTDGTGSSTYHAESSTTNEGLRRAGGSSQDASAPTEARIGVGRPDKKQGSDMDSGLQGRDESSSGNGYAMSQSLSPSSSQVNLIKSKYIRTVGHGDNRLVMKAIADIITKTIGKIVDQYNISTFRRDMIGISMDPAIPPCCQLSNMMLSGCLGEQLDSLHGSTRLSASKSSNTSSQRTTDSLVDREIQELTASLTAEYETSHGSLLLRSLRRLFRIRAENTD